MRKQVFLSDILLLLKLSAPKNYELFVFDPANKINFDTEFPLFKVSESSFKVLVTTAKETIGYRGMGMDEFDLVLDYGKSKLTEVFNQKKYNYINNPDQTMRWVFSAQNSIASFLSFYNTATTKAKLIATVIKILFKTPLKRLACSGSFSFWHKAELKINQLVDRVAHEDYSIFMGSRDVNRTLLIETNTAGRSTHFIKAPTNKHSKKSIANEKQNLHVLSLKRFQTFTTPHITSSQKEILITTNIKPQKATRTNAMTSLHYNVLQEVTRKTTKFQSLENTAFWNAINSTLNAVSNNKKYQHIVIKLNELKNQLSTHKNLYTSLAHGDFTPWNMFVDGDKLAIYDWEMAQHDAPLLYDLFHFHFQKGILSEHKSIFQIKKNILKSCEHPIIQGITTKYQVDIETNYQFYLLKTIAHYLTVFMNQKQLNIQHQWLLSAYENILEQETVVQTVTSYRDVFVKAFNKKLTYLAHAYLKFTEGSLDYLKPSSDLDILVMKNDIPKLVRFCTENKSVERIKTHEKSFMTTVELFFKDGSFLSLDLINEFKRKGLKMLDANTFLSLAQPNQYGIVVPPAMLDFEYCLLFYTLNNAEIPSQYVNHFRIANKKQRNAIYRHINKKYELLVEGFESILNENTRLKSSLIETLQASRKNRLVAKVKLQFNYLIDTLKDIINRKGMVITFSGVDGAGKTTIINLVKETLQNKYRKEVILLRHRPGILPILSAVKHGKEKAEQIASVTIPRQGKNNNVVSSLIRFAYYFTDYVIGQVYVYFKYVLRGKVVLYDRYYFDFINDAKRSNIELNRNLIKRLYWFVFKPKLNFFLYADAETILERKKEMVAPEIERITKLYKNLFKQMSKKYQDSEYKIIENKKLELTLNTILKTYSKVA